MPSLLIENMPDAVFERLQQCAARNRRCLSEETLELLRKALDREDELPEPADDLLSEEKASPYGFPRAGTSFSVEFQYARTPRVPDPFD